MLKLSPAVTVKGIKDPYGKASDYILFPDDKNPNLYYALAEIPTFRAGPNGGPDFNLTWYFGGGVKAGGICTMTVALPVPNSQDSAVRQVIVGALTDDNATQKTAEQTVEMCKAAAAGDNEKAAALRKELGLSDDAANTVRNNIWKKDEGWEQFIPTAGALQVVPVPFTAGTVIVQAFVNEQAYQAGTPEVSTGRLETTPSLFNENAAVVTFNLQDVGANLFWHGLGGWAFDKDTPRPEGYDEARGGSSVIAVTYVVQFQGLLPEATATVTLNHEVMARLKLEDQVKSGSWGRTYTEQVVTGKEYRDAVNQGTEIVLPGGGSKEDADKVRDLLTDWAAKQMADMAAAQMPAVKLEDLDINGARELMNVKEQSRTFTLTQGVTVEKRPQAQLPKIDGLVPQGASTGKFFQLINLNDMPYFNVSVTVNPPGRDYLEGSKVGRLAVTQLTYGDAVLRDTAGKEVSTLEFLASAEQKPSVSLSGTFAKSAERSLKYKYLVSYNDGTPSYQPAPRTRDPRTDPNADPNYLDLSAADLGVLKVSLSGIDLPWDILSGARADITYGDVRETVMLRPDGPVSLVKPLGEAITLPLKYQLTLNVAGGEPYRGEEVEVKPHNGRFDSVTVKNPLGDEVIPLLFGLDARVAQATLKVQYTMPSGRTDMVFLQTIHLDSAQPDGARFRWRVPKFTGKPSSFRVLKARITTKDGTQSDLDVSGGTDADVQGNTEFTVKVDGIEKF